MKACWQRDRIGPRGHTIFHDTETGPGLLQVRLTSLTRDEVPREGCRYAEEVPPGVQAGRRQGRSSCRGDLSVPEVAVDFGVSEESVRRWMRQADIDDGIKDGQTSTEQSELIALRRDKRRLAMENEILRRAALVSTGQRNNAASLSAGVS